MPQGSEVPEGWAFVSLDDVISPSKEKIEPLNNPDLKYVGLEHIESNKCRIIGNGLAGDVKSTKTVFHRGDLLYGKLRPYLNKVCVPDFEGVCSTDILVFNKNPYLDNHYLMWLLSTPDFVDYANNNSSGVQLPRINFQKLSKYPVPLPPLAEQHRIVAAIEALFARLDATNARLERVPGILKQFRQAVLAAACDGRLTEDWRAENPDVEPAKDLINAIKNEVIGKKIPQKRSLSFKLKDKPFDIPKSWEWTPISGLCISITDGNHQAPEKSDEGIPFVVISNISSGKLNLSKTMYVPVDYYNNITDNRKPKQNDILFSVTGSYGIPILIKEDKEFCFQRHIALIRVHSKISANYIYYVLKSQLVYNQATKVATGIAQLTVPLSGLRTIKIPTPPLPEQHEIVRRVDALFALADRIEARVAAARERTETMRQSILAQAFSGRLVPTEAELARQEGRDYEPASVLLERIRSEKKEKKGGRKAQSKLT